MADKTKDIPESEPTIAQKTCFIIMPIADAEGYLPSHFNRVYEHIIKPACKEAGFKPQRADDSQHSNIIILDIVKQIVESNMVICDLSSRNPNVMYELGIRQAFDLPVVLLKDEITARVFDAQHLRDVPYDSSLRIDTVSTAINKLVDALRATEEHRDDIDNRSLISLLGIRPAKLPENHELSPETSIIIDEIKSIKSQISQLSLLNTSSPMLNRAWRSMVKNMIDTDQPLAGRAVNHADYGGGVIREFDGEIFSIRLNTGQDIKVGPKDYHFLRFNI